ncbi:MAG: radical SAM/SPASM domain-containing protein [Planctomycetota bacterium]|jgi:radical SAM protein with 4Fe4S-binding SPASM domain
MNVSISRTATAIDNFREGLELNQISIPPPLRLWYEFTTRCNLNCQMCRGSGLKQIRATNLDLSSKIFRLTEPFIKTALEIHLSGFGESLLHPGFPIFLKRIRKLNPHARLLLTTNGTLLNKANRRLLVRYGIDTVAISLDGCCSVTYNKIRGADHFKKVLENIKVLASERNVAGKAKPHISIIFVIQKDNAHEMPGMVDVAAEIGAETIIFQRLATFREIAPSCNEIIEFLKQTHRENGTPDQFRRHMDLEVNYKAIMEIFRETGHKANKLGISVTGSAFQFFNALEQDSDVTEFSYYASLTDSNTPAFICVEPWQTLYITADGGALPCDIFTPSLACLKEHSLEEIWAGPTLQEFRESFRKGTRKSICLACHAFHLGNLPSLIPPP